MSFFGLFKGKKKSSAEAAVEVPVGSPGGGYIAAVVSNQKVTVFGGFDSIDAAYDWEAGTRIAMKALLSGSMEESFGGQQIALPAGSGEALKLIQRAGGVVIPHTLPEWDIIR